MDLKILILLLACLLTSVLSCFTNSNYGNLEPEVAQILVGDDLIFNCSISKNFIDQIDLSKVYFRRNTSIPIDPQFLHKLDPYTVQLKIPNASSEHSGSYWCYYFNNTENKNIEVCVSDAQVGFKPLNVTDFKCKYKYRERLSCSWIEPFNPIPTNYTLYYHWEGWHEIESKCENIGQDPISGRNFCYWDDNIDGIHNSKYYLTLEGNNLLGSNEEGFVFKSSSIVQLSPPRSLNFSNSILNWKIPENVIIDDHLNHLLRYRIYVIDNENNTRVIETEKLHQDQNAEATYKLNDLKPFTRYTVKISCKVDDPINDNWSESNSIEIFTEPQVPKSPNITDESFETIELTKPNERNVIIYWEAIRENEKNGPDFEYFILYSESSQDELKNITTKFANISLKLESDTTYNFRIYSKNSVGLSKHYSTFTLPSQTQILNKRPNIKVVKWKDGKYDLRWKQMEPSNYTVFYCKSFDDKCIESIQWFTTSNHTISVNMDSSYFYKFGVSHNNYPKSTGIVWATCIADESRPNQFDGITLNFVVSSDSMSVHWELNCEAQRVFIEKFVVKWCSQNGCSPQKEVDNKQNHYSIRHLLPDTKYTVTLMAKSKKGNELGRPQKRTIITKSSSLSILFVIIISISLLLAYLLLFYSYKLFKKYKQKNDDFTIKIAMEDQSNKVVFYNSSEPNVESYTDTGNNISESSLVETASDSANANTNNNSSNNTINETTAMFSSSNEDHENQHPSSNNKKKNSSKNYIKQLSNHFCSSDSGVSDMNHHDNLEYFYNHDDDSKEPFLKKSSPTPQIVNSGNSSTLPFYSSNHNVNNSKSAPSSNLPSPEPYIRNNNHNHHSSSKQSLASTNENDDPGPNNDNDAKNKNDTNSIDNNSSNNTPSNSSGAATAKQAYVLIPHSNHVTSRYLPHSHTTQLPDSYNANRV